MRQITEAIAGGRLESGDRPSAGAAPSLPASSPIAPTKLTNSTNPPVASSPKPTLRASASAKRSDLLNAADRELAEGPAVAH